MFIVTDMLYILSILLLVSDQSTHSYHLLSNVDNFVHYYHSNKLFFVRFHWNKGNTGDICSAIRMRSCLDHLFFSHYYAVVTQVVSLIWKYGCFRQEETTHVWIQPLRPPVLHLNWRFSASMDVCHVTDCTFFCSFDNISNV